MADPRLSRDQALDARPAAVEPVKREPLPDGGERLTVPYHPTRLQRVLLRLADTATRRYELDPLGLEVLALCDGRRTVRRIIADFAAARRLNRAEAERAVVTFLRTMLKKGLVVVAVGEGKEKEGTKARRHGGTKRRKR